MYYYTIPIPDGYDLVEKPEHKEARLRAKISYLKDQRKAFKETIKILSTEDLITKNEIKELEKELTEPEK
jgi:hypothetical protein